METRKRAVAYIRVSTKEQATDDKASLQVQKRDCDAYCQRMGYEVTRMPYVDVQTGTDTRKERPSFEQMLKDGHKGDYEVIVAWRPDRLFRSLWPAARLKQLMDATGIDVETVTVPIDKSTLGLWAWVAEREIDNIRERTLLGREGMARAGKLPTGNPAYGLRYDKSTQHLCHEDKEKPHVVGIFNWVAEGKSIGSLVANFNRLGILTRQGKSWSRQQVLKVLRNQTYMGKARWCRHKPNKGPAADKNATREIIIPVEPIVSEELFQRVQRRLDKNHSESPRNTKQVYLLQHLLYCRVCGQPFLARSHTNRHGKPLKTPERYYGCKGMKEKPGAYSCRRPAELYASTLERIVWEKVAQAFADPHGLLDILKARNNVAVGKAREIRGELDEARDQLQKKQLELQQVLTWARQRLLSSDELKPQLAQVREQKEHWETEVERLTRQLDSLRISDHNLDDARRLCLSVRSRLEGLIPLKQKEFLRLVVDRIWVDGSNNLEIEVVVPNVDKVPSIDVNCETVFS